MNFILLELKDLYEDFETELKSFIKKESNILNALKCSGKWDLILITVSESKQEFHNLLTKTRNKCGAHLQDFQTLDVFKRVKYTHLSSGYLEGVKRKDLQDLSVDFPTGGVDIFKYKKEKIDKTDLRILKELLNNARTPVTVIAKNLRLSKDSIHNRLKNLIKKEFINGFMPVINEPVLINYSIHILFLQLKNISNEKFESISNHLKNHPYTLLVFHTGDVYDFFIIPVARSPAHLNEILMIIKSKFSNEIKSHETLLLLDEYKYSEFPQH